jgi:hypothetical protein
LRLANSGLNCDSAFFVNNSQPITINGGIIKFQPFNGGSEAILARDAADILAMRNGTNAQEYRVYGTSGTATEYLSLRGQTGGAFQIRTIKGGTGAARALEFQTDGVTRVTVGETGTTTFANSVVLSGGGTCEQFFAFNHNVNIQAGGRVLNVTTISALSTMTLGSGGVIRWSTTNAFPSLRHSGTTLRVRLADDSAFAPLACGLVTADNDLEITDSTKGIIMKSPNNTRWRVTIDNAGSLIRTALALLFLAAISSTGTAQVRDLVYGTNNVVVGPTNTNALTFTNNITATGTLGVSNAVTFARANIGTTDGTLLWFGLPAQLSVQGTGGRHAIIANAPAGGSAAVIGTSSSGGAAGKFYQDTTYTSPALWVSRQAPSTNSPTLGIGSSTNGATNAKAVSVSHGVDEVFFVRHDGAVSSLYQRFGSGTPEGVVTAPVGAVYNRTDGGTGTSFYVKESGTGNTGWVAK